MKNLILHKQSLSAVLSFGLGILLLTGCARHDKFIDNRPQNQNTPSPLGLGMEGVWLTTERISNGGGYQVVLNWSHSLDSFLEVKFDQDLPVVIDQANEFERVYRRSCQPNQNVQVKIKQIKNQKVVQEALAQAICPIDVAVAHPASQASLQQVINSLDVTKNQVTIGHLVFGSPNLTLKMEIEQDTHLVIENLDIKYQGIIEVTPGPEWHKKWEANARAYALHQTALEALKSGVFESHLKNVSEVRTDLVKKAQANYVVLSPPMLTIQVLNGEGLLTLKLPSRPGVTGLTGEQAFGPWVKYLKENPIKTAGENGKDQPFEYTPRMQGPDFSGPPGLEFKCSWPQHSSPEPGKKGPSGVIQGAPGVQGGGGVHSVPIEVIYSGHGSKFELTVELSPGQGGAGGEGSDGQMGGPGGLGGRVACGEGRVASGPRGDFAPRGATGGLGNMGQCSPVTLSDNLRSYTKLKGYEECTKTNPSFRESYVRTSSGSSYSRVKSEVLKKPQELKQAPNSKTHSENLEVEQRWFQYVY